MMINIQIELQLKQLFQLEQQLQRLLEEEQYEEFQQQQVVFSVQVKALLDNHSAESLNDAIDQLKTLKERINTLQNESAKHFKQLKEKSLQQQRNKSKINAYK